VWCGAVTGVVWFVRGLVWRGAVTGVVWFVRGLVWRGAVTGVVWFGLVKAECDVLQKDSVVRV
jgi:hypothetical protein